MKNTDTYIQYGVEVSLYSGKTRAYLLHKGIPFEERNPGLVGYFHTLPRKTGAGAVPVVVTPGGEWLQDTSSIIDELERRHPAYPVLPASPALRFAAYLFELWGDEFWLPLALHGRWSYAENWPPYADEVGEKLLPFLPRWLRRHAGLHLAKGFSEYGKRLGVRPEQYDLLNRWAQIQLDGLDDHFAKHPFLFGQRPSLGDYGLIGPLYAHLGRDPWSKRELIAPRRHLSAWIERMFKPQTPQGSRGAFDETDRLPDTLTPALRSIFDEMVPLLQACADAMWQLPVVANDSKSAQRYFDDISHPLAGGQFHRNALSYPVWMAQRMLDAYHAMLPQDQIAVAEWLRNVGGTCALQLKLPRVERVGLAAARIA